MPQGDINKNAEFFNTKMAAKVTNGQKINVTRSTIYVENFILLYQKQHRVGTMPLY